MPSARVSVPSATCDAPDASAADPAVSAAEAQVSDLVGSQPFAAGEVPMFFNNSCEMPATSWLIPALTRPWISLIPHGFALFCGSFGSHLGLVKPTQTLAKSVENRAVRRS